MKMTPEEIEKISRELSTEAYQLSEEIEHGHFQGKSLDVLIAALLHLVGKVLGHMDEKHAQLASEGFMKTALDLAANERQFERLRTMLKQGEH